MFFENISLNEGGNRPNDGGKLITGIPGKIFSLHFEPFFFIASRSFWYTVLL
jgi:hypothetical protein